MSIGSVVVSIMSVQGIIVENISFQDNIDDKSVGGISEDKSIGGVTEDKSFEDNIVEKSVGSVLVENMPVGNLLQAELIPCIVLAQELPVWGTVVEKFVGGIVEENTCEKSVGGIIAEKSVGGIVRDNIVEKSAWGIVDEKSVGGNVEENIVEKSVCGILVENRPAGGILVWYTPVGCIPVGNLLWAEIVDPC